MRTAEEYLEKQGYTKTVTHPAGKLPNGKKYKERTFEPSFQRETVIRLMQEYANQFTKPSDNNTVVSVKVTDKIKEKIHQAILVDINNYTEDYYADSERILESVMDLITPHLKDNNTKTSVVTDEEINLKPKTTDISDMVFLSDEQLVGLLFYGQTRDVKLHDSSFNLDMGFELMFDFLEKNTHIHRGNFENLFWERIRLISELKCKSNASTVYVSKVTDEEITDRAFRYSPHIVTPTGDYNEGKYRGFLSGATWMRNKTTQQDAVDPVAFSEWSVCNLIKKFDGYIFNYNEIKTKGKPLNDFLDLYREELIKKK